MDYRKNMTHEDALLNCNNLNFDGFTFCLIFYFVTATRTSKESHRHFVDICLCTVVGENVMHLIHFRVHYICKRSIILSHVFMSNQPMGNGNVQPSLNFRPLVFMQKYHRHQMR